MERDMLSKKTNTVPVLFLNTREVKQTIVVAFFFLMALRCKRESTHYI